MVRDSVSPHEVFSSMKPAEHVNIVLVGGSPVTPAISQYL